MSAHLMELSFGPVQGFIAAARRTADLWSGSRMLSEIARTAGRELLDQGCELIYPDAARIDSAAEANAGEPVSNVSNVMLLKVPEGTEPEELAGKVRSRVQSHMKEWAGQVLAQPRISPLLRQELFLRQLEDALEYFVAWAPLGEDYPASCRLLKRAFAARKNSRDFSPFSLLPEVLEGLPKSSLDGHRETVLVKTSQRGLNTPLMLGEGEQLDALGVLKRALPRLEKGRVGDEARFTPLTRIALDPWIRRLQRTSEESLKTLCTAYEPLVAAGFATRVVGNSGAYKAFPYDGALIYGERLQQARIESAASNDPATAEALSELDRICRGLFRELGAPSPYAALLMADGDRMGRFVGSARTAAEHNDLTRSIAGFADEAIRICQQWNAHCVYAGGEDVMALVPLDAVLGSGVEGQKAGLARDLASAFDERIGELLASSSLKVKPEDRTSLRVGVIIAHVVEPLGVIRDWAQEAEKFAKGAAGTEAQGDALGLVLRVRAGHERRVRLGFKDDAGFGAMQQWIESYTATETRTRTLSARVGYDLIAIADELQRRELSDDFALHELERLFQRARQGGGQAELSEDVRQALSDRLTQLGDAGNSQLEALKQLGTELVLARWLSAATLKELEGEESA